VVPAQARRPHAASPRKAAGAAAAFRTRADEVYAQLKRDVAEFNLVPGDRFTENEISERLGVSRTPVRQALFRLQQEGFVEVLFRSGWRVLPFDFDQFEQFYDLRMVLETTAAHRLCEASERRIDRTLLDALAAIWLVPAFKTWVVPCLTGVWNRSGAHLLGMEPSEDVVADAFLSFFHGCLRYGGQGGLAVYFMYISVGHHFAVVTAA